ncbi:hypothetical protein KBC79_03965 [Candidatus Woesebacteria bacterium]|nr:hypothetical protein [Candidatus Woesebacteria bacterium]
MVEVQLETYMLTCLLTDNSARNAEYEEAQRRFGATTYKQQQVSPVHLMKYESNWIRFFTKKELEEMCKNPVGNTPAMIYLAGKSIG